MPQKWLELAHEKKGYIYPPMLYWLGIQYACNEIGFTDGVIATWHVNHEFSYLTKEGSLKQPALIILQRLEQDGALLEKIVEVNKTRIPTMLRAAAALTGDLSKVDVDELFHRWEEWLDEFISLMTYSGMGTVLEMEEPLLSNKLEKILAEKLGEDRGKLGTYFQILTTPQERTIAGQEEIDLLVLCLKNITLDLTNDDIDNHVRNYSWIAFGYSGPGWNGVDIRERLAALPQDEERIRALILEREHAQDVLRIRQSEIEKLLNLTEQERNLFHALRTLGFWKFERKFKNQKAHEMMEDFINEIAQRNSLSIDQAKMIAPNEIRDAIAGKMDAELLNQRIKESVVLFNGVAYKVFSGENVRKISQDINRDIIVDTSVIELKGAVAYPGRVLGRVRHVDSVVDMINFIEGEVLVSTSTSPQILPAMKRASAIITDSGGITCHAAIVAREIKIPTIIGTKIATKVFKDGDTVEVDAEKGIVRKLN